MPASNPLKFWVTTIELVARGNPIGQVDKDFGIGESFLRWSLSDDYVDTARVQDTTITERYEIVEWPRDNRVLESDVTPESGRCF